jgi:hypothetical protein
MPERVAGHRHCLSLTFQQSIRLTFNTASVSGDNKAQLLRLKEARDATLPATGFVSEPPLWRYL